MYEIAFHILEQFIVEGHFWLLLSPQKCHKHLLSCGIVTNHTEINNVIICILKLVFIVVLIETMSQNKQREREEGGNRKM